MPTVFTHAFTAAAIGSGMQPNEGTLKFFALGMGCAMLPDADVIAFAFNIPYSHMLGHRGLTHSLPFAIVFGLIVAALAYGSHFRKRIWWGYALYFILATASHGLLDAFTNGGLGVAFFAPWMEKRYFAPELWRKIQVSPIGASRFFSAYGWKVFKSEILWIWLPSTAWMGLMWWRNRRKAART